MSPHWAGMTQSHLSDRDQPGSALSRSECVPRLAPDLCSDASYAYARSSPGQNPAGPRLQRLSGPQLFAAHRQSSWRMRFPKRTSPGDVRCNKSLDLHGNRSLHVETENDLLNSVRAVELLTAGTAARVG